ncbi:hypothetical protein H5397_12420 [Propioniciclava sp. MC1683]|uniref:hypothetical protein n=1 Tax=Propioniciclava sp. MC1683 TaxID=2760309 RepID=UPI001603AE6B|nr:hypothetical protein [Propioniciclava sp. MC1683]MBB1502219.1 hypothetical protein [Propioniciclava sp. MC1683]
MSQLSQVKAQVLQVAGDAKSTAGGLSAFKSKFSQAVGQVNATIGGTTTGVDKQMIATLQAAERQLESAINALQQAAQAANDWAARA